MGLFRHHVCVLAERVIRGGGLGQKARSLAGRVAGKASVWESTVGVSKGFKSMLTDGLLD